MVVSALRTPICKAKRGALKDCPADDMLAAVLKATLQQTGVEPQVRLLLTLALPCILVSHAALVTEVLVFALPI